MIYKYGLGAGGWQVYYPPRPREYNYINRNLS